ncbi:amidohydrolase [Flavobacterium sp. ZB4P23]|uniref:amidohydrolase n=1 Tax=unclassified Flavobacterium TaxID=196869 RepID=UPI000F8461B8|nr:MULTISPECIES: amidohydrolase [unclassified Flavobacterium]RTY81615.1 amidohydrolase [Flavobacterium sp. ZB4P23]RTZ07519.1 amidohydrolase [Flavobacterium sp. GSP6]
MENSNPSIETLVRLRKELHKHPEVSGKENQTAKRVLSFLENYPPDELITGVGTTGVVAIYKGKKNGKTVLFRCELDALPIEETNRFEHRSLIDGVSHKCGHDGHMAILCGLAAELHQNKPDSGTVILLFQPAEEDGSGAQKVFSDTKFTLIQPDYVFALHNLPGFPMHQIVVKNETFTCAVNSIIIKLKGKTAHAGEPERGINPTLAIAAIINQFNATIQTDITKENYCQITPIYTKIGKKAYGVAAGAGEIHFTVRSDSNLQMRKIEIALENAAQSIAKEYQLKCKTQWTQSFQANENDKTAVAFIKKAAEINGFELFEKEKPFTWGEDFGLFTQHYPGAMFGLGAGVNTAALHNPDYDFPDEIIATGVAVFHHISKQITNAH